MPLDLEKLSKRSIFFSKIRSKLYTRLHRSKRLHFCCIWDVRDENDIIRSEDDSGKFIAKTERAVMEPLFASHFGNTFIDQIFERFAVYVTANISKEKTNYFTVTLSLTIPSVLFTVSYFTYPKTSVHVLAYSP